MLCREARGWPHMEQAHAVWKGALLDAGTSAHVKNPGFAPRPGQDAGGRNPPPPRVCAGLTSRRQTMTMRVCGSSWRQLSSGTGTSGSSAIRRSSSSEVRFATARMRSRNFPDMGVVVWYMPPVCLRTSARTKPGGRRFPWPLFSGFSAGVTTSADVLNVAMLHRPGYRSQRAGRAAARHHGQVQFATRRPDTALAHVGQTLCGPILAESLPAHRAQRPRRRSRPHRPSAALPQNTPVKADVAIS